MAYVELNPIHANMAANPETSDFTSIKQRIEERNSTELNQENLIKETQQTQILLKQFLAKDDRLKDQIPYSYHEYLYLVDWTGRVIREDKRGAINNSLPPILLRLGIDPQYWCKMMLPKGNHSFSRTLGCQDKLRAYAAKLEIGWIKGVHMCGKLFPV